jgi:hypothetical protein
VALEVLEVAEGQLLLEGPAPSLDAGKEGVRRGVQLDQCCGFGKHRVQDVEQHLVGLVLLGVDETLGCGESGEDTGSVRHVEVFPVDSVRTAIIGRPRPLPRQRRADQPYTLNCEEPVIRDGGRFVSTLGQSPDQVPTQTASVVPVYANSTREILDELAHTVATGQITVTVQQVFTLQQAPAALAAFGQGTLGKLVITTDCTAGLALATRGRAFATHRQDHLRGSAVGPGLARLSALAGGQGRTACRAGQALAYQH